MSDSDLFTTAKWPYRYSRAQYTSIIITTKFFNIAPQFPLVNIRSYVII
jgi:hypothetical protein